MKEQLKIRKGMNGSVWHVAQPSSRLAAHHHDELELNLILSGRADYLCEDRHIPLRTGSMIWLFPEQEHLLIDWSADFSMWVVVFSPSLVRQHTGDGGRSILRAPSTPEIFCREISARSTDLLSHIFEGIAQEEKDLEFVNAALGYGLIASWEAYRLSEDTIARTDVHTAVAKAARLVSDAATSLSLDEISTRVGLSAPRLSRLFKQQTGVSLTLFRQRKCLRQFLRLYRNGARYSLIEAALLAGFGSYPQFHRVFSQLMEMSPASYKRNQLAGARRSIEKER